MLPRSITVAILFVLLGAVTALAVLFASTSNVTYNTTAPGGSLTNSGWQYQGDWREFLGTPIAPRYLLVAKHITGSTNDVFIFNSLIYHPIASTDCSNADLRVWQVAETFPMYAQLYTKTDETGRQCLVFGRGTQRGDPVIVDGRTNGWRWGTVDNIQRWGENNVAGIADGGTNYNDLLACTFDRGAGSNECHLSVGDSSGALFIQDGSTWKLAGVHLTVDGPFNTTNSDAGEFDAALLDKGGLWEKDSSWYFHTNEPADIPSAFYSTRISSHIAWINSVINFEPGIDLQITSVNPVGNDVQISFTTGTNKVYVVEHRDDLTSGNWSSVTNGVQGTGSITTVTDAGAATLPKRFYRVGLVP